MRNELLLGLQSISNISSKGLILFDCDEADGSAGEDVLAPLGPVDLTPEIAVIVGFKVSASVVLVVAHDDFIEIVRYNLGHLLNSYIGILTMNCIHVETLNVEPKLFRDIECRYGCCGHGDNVATQEKPPIKGGG